MLYLKDVHVVISNNCRLLKELVRMFPDCKWIIVGEFSCQDLTFAGPLRGVLGLVGSSSCLFFVLLCMICAVQRLVGVEAVGSWLKMPPCHRFTWMLSIGCLAYSWTNVDAMCDFFFARSCLDKVPGGALFSQRSMYNSDA